MVWNLGVEYLCSVEAGGGSRIGCSQKVLSFFSLSSAFLLRRGETPGNLCLLHSLGLVHFKDCVEYQQKLRHPWNRFSFKEKGTFETEQTY